VGLRLVNVALLKDRESDCPYHFSTKVTGEAIVNRKLIRTTLAEVKEREMQAQQARRIAPEPPPSPPPQPQQQSSQKKKIPPEQTNAESFYYKKQMDAHTPMVVVLRDNEELRGTIEWYDKNSIKLHRNEGPNLLILKHNIKYMYKDEVNGKNA
jgi:sRNA-binding regulator protein Hfq